MLIPIAVVALMILGLVAMAAVSPNGMDYRSREVSAQWRHRRRVAVREQRRMRLAMAAHRLTHRSAPTPPSL